MKNWCKIIKLKKHDVLVERLTDEDNKEVVRMAAQNPGGMLVQTAGFDTKEQADEFYSLYGKKQGDQLVNDLNEMIPNEEV